MIERIIRFFSYKKPTIEELSKRVYIEFIVFTEGLSAIDKVDVLKNIQELILNDLETEELSLKEEIGLINEKIKENITAKKSIKN